MFCRLYYSKDSAFSLCAPGPLLVCSSQLSNFQEHVSSININFKRNPSVKRRFQLCKNVRGSADAIRAGSHAPFDLRCQHRLDLGVLYPLSSVKRHWPVCVSLRIHYTPVM